MIPAFDSESVSTTDIVAIVPPQAIYTSDIADFAFGTSITSDIALVATYYDTNPELKSTPKPVIIAASTTAIHDQAIESLLRDDEAEDHDAWDSDDLSDLLATIL